MADSELRTNSLRLRFDRGVLEPTDVQIFEFMRTRMGLRSDNLLSMYKDKMEQSVIIKFKNEASFSNALRDLPGELEFVYDKYQSTNVKISSANAIIRYVRLFNLPPEIDDAEIGMVMVKYGKVLRMVREKYGAETGFPIWNSVRGVYLEVKDNVEIPASLFIRNLRTRVFYDGLINKCFQCGSMEHLKADCPSKRSVNDRLQSNGPKSYSDAITSGKRWNKQQRQLDPTFTMLESSRSLPGASEVIGREPEGLERIGSTAQEAKRKTAPPPLASTSAADAPAARTSADELQAALTLTTPTLTTPALEPSSAELTLLTKSVPSTAVKATPEPATPAPASLVTATAILVTPSTDGPSSCTSKPTFGVSTNTNGTSDMDAHSDMQQEINVSKGNDMGKFSDQQGFEKVTRRGRGRKGKKNSLSDSDGSASDPKHVASSGECLSEALDRVTRSRSKVAKLSAEGESSVAPNPITKSTAV